MQSTTNLVSSDLLKLPVVLTPRAWQEAVHIETLRMQVLSVSDWAKLSWRPTENCTCNLTAHRSISASIVYCLPAIALIESGWT